MRNHNGSVSYVPNGPIAAQIMDEVNQHNIGIGDFKFIIRLPSALCMSPNCVFHETIPVFHEKTVEDSLLYGFLLAALATARG